MIIDAVIIATDIQKGVAGSEVRDKLRLTVDGHSASMEFLLQYFRAGNDAQKAAQALTEINLQKLPIPNSGPFLYQYLQRHGYHAKLITFFSLQKDKLITYLKEHPRTVILSTTFFPSAQQIEPIAAFVKDHAPDTTIIAGGIQIWKSYMTRLLLDKGLLPQDIYEWVAKDHYFIDPSKKSAIDILVVSDKGEHTLHLLLKHISEGKDYTDLNNIAYFSDHKWHINDIKTEPAETHTMDWSHLQSSLPSVEIPVSVGTGCPFRCAFCDFHCLRPQYRRPTESILQELLSIPLINGKRKVFFTDDSLFASLKQAKNFCRSLINADLSLNWRSFMRVDFIDKETSELMAQSGCRECLLGVETGDAGLINNMMKKTTPDKIIDAVSHLNRVGINTQSTLIVGFPGETDITLQNTIDMLNAYPTDGPAVHMFYPFLFLAAPLAPVSSPESRAKYQLKGYMHKWSHYTMNASEAEDAMVKLYESVKMDLSPIYHGERLVDWLAPDKQKRVIYLRNKLHRIVRGQLPQEDKNASWRELEEIFLSIK